MGRYKLGETNTMPAWALRVRLLDSVRQFGGPWVEGDCSLPAEQRRCVVCVAAGENGVDQRATVKSLDLWLCCHCFQAWHRECACGMDCIKEISESAKLLTDAATKYPEAGSFCCKLCAPGLD